MIGVIRRHAAGVVFGVLVLTSGALNVVLGRQVDTLHERSARYRRMLMFPYVGQWVPTVRAGTLSADSVTIGETRPGQVQVVLAFGASCPFSLGSLSAWQRLATTLHADSAQRFEIVWVSVSPRDSTERFAAEHALTQPVALPPDAKMERIYRLRATPVTLVIDHRGRVAYARPGVIDSPAVVDSVLAAARQATVVARPRPAVSLAVPESGPAVLDSMLTQPRRSQ